jgi:sirohydrochlorin cobaltochelatase
MNEGGPIDPAQKMTVFLAHGSSDPAWRQPIEAIARRAQQLAPQATIRCAYLERMEPSLPQCVADLVAQGAQGITIAPLFLGAGKHAREDVSNLTAQLKQDFPAVQFGVQPFLGENADFVDLVARLCLAETPPDPHN